jgi:hypothetical protein
MLNNLDLCGEVIGKDKCTKRQGKWFHKKCFKNKKKELVGYT